MVVNLISLVLGALCLAIPITLGQESLPQQLAEGEAIKEAVAFVPPSSLLSHPPA